MLNDINGGSFKVRGGDDHGLEMTLCFFSFSKCLFLLFNEKRVWFYTHSHSGQKLMGCFEVLGTFSELN